MQPNTAKRRPDRRSSDYFEQKAEQLRRQLSDLDVRIIRYEKQVRDFPNGSAVLKIRNILADLKRRREKICNEMLRALFNAGRR